MGKLFLPFFLLICATLVAQTKLTVLDGFMEDQPLSDVLVVSTDNQVIGKTDKNGEYIVPIGVNTVELNLPGFETKKVFVYGKDLILFLEPIMVELNSAKIVNTDAEARKLIRQVINQRKNNQIENLNTYEYVSDSKL